MWLKTSVLGDILEVLLNRYIHLLDDVHKNPNICFNDQA